MKSCLHNGVTGPFSVIFASWYHAVYWFCICVCLYSQLFASWPISYFAITSTSASIPHVLTFCKHVWLYVLTLLPSGCSPQAPFRHEALIHNGPREMFSSPSLWIPGHYYHQILLLTFLPERLLRAAALFFLPHQIHISLCDFSCFCGLWSAEVWELILNYVVW